MSDPNSLPASWVTTKLGDICTHPQYGFTTKAADEGKLKFLRTSDITSGHIDWDTVPYCRDEPDSPEQYLLEDGDVVISRAGSVGFSYLLKMPPRSVFASYLIRFRPLIDKQFFAYFLISPFYWTEIAGNKVGIAVGNVNASKLREIPFPLPPLAEQRRIVGRIEELFSELDKGIENLKQALNQLTVYRQALLKHAFEGKLTAHWRKANADKLEPTDQLLARIRAERDARYQERVAEWNTAISDWEVHGRASKRPIKPRGPEDPEKPSSEHLERIWSLPPSWQWLQIGTFAFVTKLAGFEYTDYVQYSEDGDLRVIKAENAGPNGFRVTNHSRIRSDSIAQLKRSILMGGELLVVFVGAGTGNVATVPTGTRFFLGPNIAMARTETDAVSTKYTELFLRSPGGRDMILAAAKAVAQPSLSMETIRQAPIAIPSTAEQEEILRQLDGNLDAIIALESDIDINLQKAEALRQSILKKAFAGELVLQDPNDEPAAELLARIRAQRAAYAATERAPKKPATRRSPSAPSAKSPLTTPNP
jgi:type I restriction enzyme S subunit